MTAMTAEQNGTTFVPDQITQYQQQVQSFQSRIATLEQEARERRVQHERDILIVGDRLNQEAEDRDWCEDYDDIVDALNARLTVKLPLRDRTETYTVTIRATMTATLTYSHEVEASNADDAQDEARSYFENHVGYSACSMEDVEYSSVETEVE